MGDADLSLPALGQDGTQPREVTVLVTGFGPFKTFNHNPSYHITTQLSPILLPTTDLTTSSPTPSQPIIRLLIHPHALRVSYPTVATTIPTLFSTLRPDYVLHLGMAAGRRHYALETLAHRDGYTTKDVDNIDGVEVGSRRWAAEGCPPILEADWDPVDVLNRWRHAVKIAAGGNDSTTTTKPATIPDVRLSDDAGRFACEFIFYQSLSERWKGAQSTSSSSSTPLDPSVEAAIHVQARADTAPPGQGRQGKVAFLHVPGDYDPAAIERGARVTEAAIRALVSSWEEGHRREGGRMSGRVGVEFVG